MPRDILTQMILYFGTDSRRIAHAMKVYSFSYALWEAEASENCTPESDTGKESLLIAAILHDIGIHEAEKKYHSTAGKYQEIEGPPIAERIMKECGVPDEIAKRVLFLIGNHHSYQKIDGTDFQILVEADLIVNLEEDRLGRDAILAARERYMKTAGAKRILDSYLLLNE